jgi:hypothetical protein
MSFLYYIQTYKEEGERRDKVGKGLAQARF